MGKAFAALAILVAVAVFPSPVSAQTVADIEIRDQLIADQENLLNTYRCRFKVDLSAVANGCANRRTIQPGAAPPNPTQQDIDARDGLIRNQENLLNVYRCRYGIDTHIVPGGCVNGKPTEQTAVAANLITVPPSGPLGRCAAVVLTGVYQWEQCAWAEYWEDPTYNRSLSDTEAQELIARIWAEVDVGGKPTRPPTAALIPAGSECATAASGGFIIGCYQPDRHHIRRLDSFLETLLHETAHALVANHPSIQQCLSLTGDDEYQACAHNDIFRCVANHLYMKYAGIPDAGVCGKTPESRSTGFQPTRWASDTRQGDRAAYVDADWHTRPSPYEDSRVRLIVRCLADGTLDAYFSFDEGFIEGTNGWVPVAYVFLPEGFSEWGSERQREHIAAYRVDADWHESTRNQAVFLPERLHEGFLNDAVNHAALLIRAWDSDGNDFGLMAYSLDSAYDHIRPVTEHCGWVWGDHQSNEPEPTPTPQPDDSHYSFQLRCRTESWGTIKLEALWDVGQTNFDYETRRFGYEIREQSSGRVIDGTEYVHKFSTGWEWIVLASPNSGQVYEMRVRERHSYNSYGSWSTWAVSNRC